MQKRLFVLFMIVFLLYFPFAVGAQNEEGGLASMASQNSMRSCLKRVAGGTDPHPRAGKMVLNGTLQLAGNCLSETGCEIHKVNPSNTNIGITQDDEKRFCEGGSKPDTEKCQHAKDELARQADTDPFNGPINDFTINNGADGGTSPQGNKMVAFGPVDISVTDRFVGEVPYSYYAVGEPNVIALTQPAGDGSTNVAGDDKTQILGTFGLDTIVADPTEETEENNCVTLFWDPFGRVFDAVSLDPIPYVDVVLIDYKTGKPAAIAPPSPNWDYTKINNGIYNIMTDREGDYQLQVTPPPTHLFTRKINLPASYSTVYSEIYLPGDVFHEVPMPAVVPKGFDYSKYHHDIPVVPLNKPYIANPEDVYVVQSSVRSSDMGSFINYSGRATFPKAKVCLVGATSKKIYGACVNAEQYGNFRMNIKKDDVPTEKLFMIAQRVDLTKPLDTSNILDLSRVDFTNPKLASIEPTLHFVEGYAYDNKGQIIPNAKISIRLKDGGRVFSWKKADAKGYFKIESKMLPFLEYYLEFTSPSLSTPLIQSTSEFVKLNNKYYENINSGSGAAKSSKANNQSTDTFNPDTPGSNVPTSTNRLSLTKLLVTGLIVLFLVVVLVAIFIYIKKRGPTHQTFSE